MTSRLAVVALLLAACSSNTSTTADIGPEGGVVVTGGGIELDVPAGALAEVTTITLEELDATDALGVRFEPDGLTFASPATLRVPVPSQWGREGLLRLDFRGADPDDAVQQRLPPVVSDGVATMPIDHFSGIFCARNCHAGTIRHILTTLEQRGCSRDDVLEHVRQRFPDVDINDDSCGGRSPHAVQAVLDSFFVDQIGYDEGQEIGEVGASNLIETAASGRMVAFLFKPGEFGGRDDSVGFYPGVAHSAMLENVNGEWMLRNSLATISQRLINALNGNTVWFPADRIDEFRQSPSGVATELQLCGEPGCLAAPDRNAPGIDLYLPVDERPVPWTATRIFFEDPAKVAAMECDGGGSGEGYPRTYTGPGEMTRTVAIDYDDMSSVSCDGQGEWTATLGDDGTITLAGGVDVSTQYSGGAACNQTVETFNWSGTYDPNTEAFIVTVPYQGQDFDLVGSYGLDTLRVNNFSLERTARLAGFEERNVTWTEALNLTLQRQ